MLCHFGVVLASKVTDSFNHMLDWLSFNRYAKGRQVTYLPHMSVVFAELC